jgi:hypothetical protein
MILFTTALTLASPSFDAGTPDARFTDRFTTTHDGEVEIWSVIERWVDPDEALFPPASFNEALGWRDGETSPFIASCFGTERPASGTFLLHHGLHNGSAQGTPVLLVPGAGDNASRAWVTLAARLSNAGRPEACGPHPLGSAPPATG